MKIYRQTRMLALVGMLAVAGAAGACAKTGNTGPGGQPGPTATDEDQWRMQLPQATVPPSQCATASYPKLQWTAVACAPAPAIPQSPRDPSTPRVPDVVGNGEDLSAMAPSGHISQAIGSFDSASVTSEAGQLAGSGPQVANTFSLQLNTDFFTTPACAGSPNVNCKGWEQFIFDNRTANAWGYIQYWLIQYNAPCPSGGVAWNQFSFAGSSDIYCWHNAPSNVPVPPQPATNLANLRVAGVTTATTDAITVYVGGTAYMASGDNRLSLSGGWGVAEFNVFGNGGGSQANFNSGASANVRTRIIYGGSAAPTCLAQGFTGETNNLGFTASPPAAAPPGPALEFGEDTSGGSVPDCAADGTTIGDTHLHTFGGTSYDFQATGDFLLAQANPNFTVQARQVSAAVAGYPDAAMNSAIATKMGATRVAVCASKQADLYVNGSPISVASGAARLVDGVSISRSDDTYTVIDEHGNSIQVTLRQNGTAQTWLDVNVGLGQWPTTVRGLLGNADNSAKVLQGGDGQTYQTPIDFAALYGTYGQSWRVPVYDSLLNDCGQVGEEGNPKAPFFVDNLDPTLRRQAQQICQQTGVKENAPTILDECTLDVAVLGKDAAQVYVGATEPAVNGNHK
jgi:hypothetical protein